MLRQGLISAAVAIALAGCGGTSGTSSTPQPSAPPPPAQSAPAGPVVAMGDSITARWGTLCGHFADCVNAGIPGQTTDDMLRRFQTDVLAHKPGVVILLGGTNDMYEEVATIDNITTMAQDAAASGARVVIGLVTPANNWLRMVYKGLSGEAAINQWNADLRLMAKAYGYAVVNYHDAMLLPGGTQNDALFIADVLHPNEDGYTAMWGTLRPVMLADGVSVTN